MVARVEETWAIQIVARILSVQVIAHDDGSMPSMPDALILRPSGPVPMEVFGHWDSDYFRMKDGLRKFGRRIAIEPGAPAWEITLVHSVARIKSLIGTLPALVEENALELSAGSLPDELTKLGIEDARQLPGRTGYINLSAAGWNSWDYPASFEDWLDNLFANASDVAEKLAKYGGAEQHAFVWVQSLSAWSALEQLEIDEEVTLPNSTPNVPRSLSDIWIASTIVRPSRGILHWNRSTGWTMHPFNLTPADWEL